MLQSGGQNQKWPRSGPSGYITLAVWGIPDASERGTKSEVAHKWAQWLHNPCRLGGVPDALERGTKPEVAQKWAQWLHNPCPLGGPLCFRAETQSEVAHKWAKRPITPTVWGTQMLHSGGQKVAQKWPKSSET